ncbi:MAG: response regulator [Bacteroidota bacterium]
MKTRNLKIGIQLLVGFGAMLLFVIILGVVSYFQSVEIHKQTETMYNHPLKVRRVLGMFRSDIISIHRDMKDLLLASDEKEMTFDLNQMETLKSDAFDQIGFFYNDYLGPRSHIDSLKLAFVEWNSIREETIRLIRAGKIEEASARTKVFGVLGKQADILLVTLQKIDDFAKVKGDDLYAASIELKDSLNSQLILLVTTILLLSLIIYYYLLRNIRRPLNELTSAAKRFESGDMTARSAYSSENEFGALSASFNSMVERIQENRISDKKIASLAGLMLSEYDAKKFFQATLSAMATHTGSQMAAIYLLSDDKKTFDHFESIGVDNNARKSFAADNFEGEFGPALLTRKVQYIKNIPANTRFVFHTVSGQFIPTEIITLPILADDEVVAIISLASVSPYSNQSLQLIESILVTLCARVEGILAYHKIKEFSEKLGRQNNELEAQKTELASQSSEMMEQNAELEMQKKQLDEASRLKTVFLSNMSHELRTPLNSVIALSGVLNRRLANQIPEDEYKYLEVIERNGKHLLSLINDILDISRIEAGREELEITTFDANSLIAELIAMIQPQAKQKNIELLQTERDADLVITSDSIKIHHVLQNIIGNAVKFTETGKVVVTGMLKDMNLVITVTDTGIGIAEDHLHHIFDEFRQADSSTSRHFGGTGLGLAIAKKYAGLLGGNITVTSISGKGSEFTLTLPLNYFKENNHPGSKITHFDYPMKKSSLQLLTGNESRTILLVEDSEPAIIQIQDILMESGYNILLARDGREALEIISGTLPDAMILDLMMPGIDGFQVLKTIREAERTSHIPVLILTAKHITKEELSFLKRNNVHQLIQKGDVNLNELLNAVATMISSETKVAVSYQWEPPLPGSKPVVLVVEDNADNMITVKAILQGNYMVLEAVDGRAGVEMAKKHKPDLILMDIELPVMDGIEAFKAIHNDMTLQHVPVIALTASAMSQDRETILACGFNAYITKPIDEKVFFKSINEALYGKY